MYMKKNSIFTSCIANGIRKMTETGIINNLLRRHIVPEPECRPLQSKGQPLGMEKFGSLFLFYMIGCVACLVILVIENIYKPSRSQTLQYKMNCKKEAISRSMKHLEAFSNEEEVKLVLLEMQRLNDTICN